MDIPKINITQLTDNGCSQNIGFSILKNGDNYNVSISYGQNGNGDNANINKNRAYQGTPAKVKAAIEKDYPDFAAHLML